MKTIPGDIHNCNRWLQNRNTTQILNPSNSTDLENSQNSSAFPYAKTLGLIPSNSMGLRFKQKPLRAGLASGKRHIPFSNWNALRTELSRIHSSSLFRIEDETATNIWPMRQFNKEYQSPPNLEPLIREVSRAKNPLIVFPRLPETYRDQLHSHEAIAERLRLSASSAEAATDNDQPEVGL